MPLSTTTPHLGFFHSCFSGLAFYLYYLINIPAQAERLSLHLNYYQYEIWSGCVSWF